jgi:protein TonB
MGRTHVLDLTLVELNLAPSSLSVVQSQPPLDEEWRYPQTFQRVPPPPPKAIPKPEPPPQAAPIPAAGTSGDQGAGTFRSVAQVSQLPHFTNQVKAQYPEVAKHTGIEGVVILQVDIDATGAVKKVELIQGLGYGCDEAAIAAIQQSTFSPALAGREPVPVRFRIPYRFKIED